MKLENYKTAMNCIDISRDKYDDLMSALEREPESGFDRKKTIAVSVTAVSMAAVLGITAAAEGILFPRMSRAFNNTVNSDIPAADSPDDYAFVPETGSLSGDGVTINVKEAAADNHSIIVFMDLIYDDSILDETLRNKTPEELNSVDFGFDIHQTLSGIGIMDTSQRLKVSYVEDNLISIYMYADGLDDHHWAEDSISIQVGNFGYYTVSDNDFSDFKTLSNISGTIDIPVNQIKRNESKYAVIEIDGVKAEMELSLLGFDIKFDSEEEYKKIEDKICYKGFIDMQHTQFYMKDGRILGDGKDANTVHDILGSLQGRFNDDGTFSQYVGFIMPIDTEQIDKITIKDCEFNFN